MSSTSLPKVTRAFQLPELTGPKALKIVTTDVPAVKENEVLVKVHAVSLQYRDLIISLGQYPLSSIKENVVPGSDCAGEVLSVGSEVKNFKAGDRVCANFSPEHVFGEIKNVEERDAGLGGKVDGVMTQYRTFPAYCLVRVPEHLSYEEASTLPCAALTAYNGLYGSVPLKGGDDVLVLGSGGVSVFALQLAKASGARVIATTSSSDKAKVLKKLGADIVINYKETPDWDDEVLKITKGRGVDHVIEIGGAGTMAKSVNAARFSGWVHVIGFVAGDGDTSNLLTDVLRKAVHVRGILIGSRAQFEDMNRLISTAQLKPVIDKVFSFEEYPQALEYLQSQKHVGKVVVKVVKN